ncbi:hypothetical protein CRYUN_Cryun35bG0034500 [Craigia yunnanensis]
MFPQLLFFTSLLLINAYFFRFAVAQTCPPPPTCPPISPPPRPTRTVSYVRPRPPLYNPSLRLLPRQPKNNPGPLANRARILAITQELKRNITFDPQGYTRTWVGNNYCLFKGFLCDTVPDRNITGLAGLSGLRYFYEIDLSNNKFLGGFPSNVLGATNLTFVDLRFNKYLGSVPRSLFNFDTDVLFINNNVFSQIIPSNFGNTPALYLTLANNNFTGTIPRSIGAAWPTMTEVLFLGNKLSGCLPFEIGYLNRTTVFDVGSNRLTGPIPQSFGCMARLQLLNMAHNSFYGPIPEVLCRLPNAFNFTLSNNYFTQVGPQCRRLIRLRRLNVNRNCIMGLPFQRSAADCESFFAKPRTCARESTFSIIPCSLPAASLRTRTVSQEDEVPPAPRSYNALVKPPH